MIDMKDPKDIQVLGYPGNPLDWPIVLELQGLELVPGQDDPNGLRPLFDRAAMDKAFPNVRAFPNDRNGNPNPPNEGWIQYTFWPVVLHEGRWATFPAIEFWGDRFGDPRIGTGAIVNNWNNWVYWLTALANADIRLGAPFGAFLTSGDRRRMDVGDVRVRTNIWFGTLEWGVMPAATSHAPEPPAQTTPEPGTPTTPPSLILGDALSVLLSIDKTLKAIADHLGVLP